MITEEYVTCSCCGKGIKDNPEENLDFHERGQDTGFGRCTDCFGQPKAKAKNIYDETSIRKKLGWAGCAFYDARIETLQKNLDEPNLSKFNAMPFGKKVIVISRMVEKGYMV